MHSDLKFKWDYNLKPVTVIAILNFQFSHDDSWPKDRYHSSYRLREDRDPLFTRLFLLAEINTFTAEEYKQYKKSLENMRFSCYNKICKKLF